MEVLNKALGSQQALAWDDEDGNLLISLVGNDKAPTVLVWGENILTCDTEQSIRERFSEYQVRASGLETMLISAKPR